MPASSGVFQYSKAPELSDENRYTATSSSIVDNDPDAATEKSFIGDRIRRYSGLREHGNLDNLPPGAEAAIKGLARTISNRSRQSQSTATAANPITDGDDPTLDPNSPKFDIEHWLKTYLSIISQDQGRYPRRTAGVSFRDLTVYGFGRATDYQKNVLNIFLAGLQKVHGCFQPEYKFPILKDFDGLIRPGEMCVVLGRPGRWVKFGNNRL